LLLYSSKPSLGVFQLAGHLISYTIDLAPSSFSGAVAGEEWKTSARGVFHTHILYFVLSFALLYFYLHNFISKTQKKFESLVVVISIFLVHYVVP
jgi:hypothetical protein